MLTQVTTNASLQARKNAACAQGIGTLTPHFTARADNAELWDVEGQRFVDFASGIATLATGHRHPRIVAAVRAQLDDFHHTCFHVTPYEEYVAVCEQLNRLVPGRFAKKSALFTTGAEAIENAMKVARAARAGEFLVLRDIILPASLPAIFTGLRLAVGAGWLTVVTAEMIAVKSGLGYMILNGQLTFRSDLIIAGIIVIGAIGLLADQLVRAARGYVCRWQEGLTAANE